MDKRPGVTVGGVLRNWGLVFLGNFGGALTVAFMMAFVFTYGFSIEPEPVGEKIATIDEARTVDMRNMVQLAGLLSSYEECCVTGWFQWMWSVR